MRELKNTAVCAAWITGLLLAGWLLWFFTESPRERELVQRVNRILAARDETIILSGVPVKNRRLLPLGTEFMLVSGDGNFTGGSFLVFPLVSGGTALSCGALIDPQGRVERLIPLGTHGEQIFERIPTGILNVYIRRIERGKPL
ncbi:MAG: hypothetical protein LBF63_12205 [Treponema sp.]|jgi:hypothetical protein|nr:hypothetical protein [Treponema sp.]